MKSQFATLLKKQLADDFSFVKRKKRIDVLGIFLSLFLATVFVGVVGFVFSKFIPIYSSINFNHIYDPTAREFEILTVVYTAVILTGIFSAVRNINNSIFESDDIKVLVYLPVKPAALLATKLVGAYIKSLVTTVMIVVPINLTFGIVSGAPLYYGFMTVLVCLVLPLINISFATILALPAYFLKRILSSRYLVTLIMVVTLLGVLFWGYSAILTTLKTILENRDLTLFFNHDTMSVIIGATKFMYPANLVANILLQRDMLLSSIVLFSIILLGCIIGFLLVKIMLQKAMQQRFQSNIRFVYHKKERKRGKSNVFVALSKKEFLSVLRVPSYAFQYFAMAIIMPLMVYFSLSLLVSLVTNLMFIACEFELCIFVIMIFSVLTNTFCATNISRDGQMFFVSKTLPFTHRQIVFSKILFSSVVSIVSLLACSIMIVILGYVSILQAMFIFFVTLCLSVAQIAFATRMDFNRPHFSDEVNGEIKESNSTISTIIVLGLLFAVIIGGLSLYLSLFLRLKYEHLIGSLATYFIVGFCAIAMLASGIFYLLHGLGKKYYEGETKK